MNVAPEPASVLPYPHARNDCGLCREMDADFEIVEEALDPAPDPADRRVGSARAASAGG